MYFFFFELHALQWLFSLAWSESQLRNYAHVKKMGHISEFVWHLLMKLKNNYLLKKLLKWNNKNVRILIFKCSIFLKNKEKHLEIPLFYTFLCTMIRYNMIWYDMIWLTVLECNRRKLVMVIIGHFLPFILPPPLKTKKYEFLQMCTKNHNHIRYGF